MKTLKLKKDVVEQLTSNQAQNAMGGAKTIQTCMGCPIVQPAPDTVIGCINNRTGCLDGCVTGLCATYGCTASENINCMRYSNVAYACIPVQAESLAVTCKYKGLEEWEAAM